MKQHRTIRIGGVPEHFNTPLYQIAEQPDLHPKGWQVQWRACSGGTGEMRTLLREQALDMAILLTEGAVAGMAQGEAYQIVKFHTNSPLIWGIHVAGSSTLTTPEDCLDKRFAISRPNSGSHLMAQLFLHERGVDPTSASWVEVGNLQGGREALQSGMADVFLWEKYTTLPVVQSGVFKRIGEYPTPWPGFVWVVRQAFLEAHPEVVQHVLHACHQQIHQLQQNSTSTVQHISERFGIPQEQIARWYEELEWNTEHGMHTALLEEVSRTLVHVGILDEPAHSRIFSA